MNCSEIWNFCGVGHKKTAPKFQCCVMNRQEKLVSWLFFQGFKYLFKFHLKVWGENFFAYCLFYLV